MHETFRSRGASADTVSAEAGAAVGSTPSAAPAGAPLSGAAPDRVGRILAVCLSARRGTAKTPVPEARLARGRGLVGDAHAGGGPRQVSLLARESADKLRDRLPGLADGAFGENLTTEGIDLGALRLGARLRVGARALLEVTQIGKSCHRGCEIARQVGDCVMPREGIFARVVRGGVVRPGDRLAVAAAPEPAAGSPSDRPAASEPPASAPPE